MAERTYRYVVVGAGLAGAAAVEGIRELDGSGSILLIGDEPHLPYNRPPLSKKLWFGKTTLDRIYVHDESFYRSAGVDLALGVTVTGLDCTVRTATDSRGDVIHYEKLLLATGGAPRKLGIPGSDEAGLCLYRTLDDYLRVRNEVGEGRSALVVGGGFIGSEMAAALSTVGAEVTMVFPDPYLCRRVFPEDLGKAVQNRFQERGIRVIADDVPASFSRKGDQVVMRTMGRVEVTADVAVVGIGIKPNVYLAEQAGLETRGAIVVDEYLCTSDADVYAAGDNSIFPYQALGRPMHVEHWDNALSQGKHAGRNMAGANEPFSYMPYFFSDLFEFGYEAVGEVDSSLDTYAEWEKEFDTGVVYYLADGKVRGAMMCNVWGKVDAARDLIRSGRTMAASSLHGAIPVSA